MTEGDTLRVAVAGTSFAGSVQVPVFQSSKRTKVVAVSSGSLDRAELVANEHDIPAAYTDFEEMLDNEKLDLVSIATPTDLHRPMVLAAVHRGIHVLCEKPFAMNTEEAREMLTEAEKAGVIAMIDFEFRYLPARTYLAHLLRQKYVGEIRMIEFTRHFGWRSKPEDVAWDWWSDQNRGGGLLGALGSHAVDSLRLWVGEPRRVFCDLSTFVQQREGLNVTSDDSYVMILEFDSDIRAVVQMSAVSGVENSQIGIYGSEGQVNIPGYRCEKLLGGKRRGRAIKELTIPKRHSLSKEPGHFLRAPFRILTNSLINAIDRKSSSPSPNFADGLASQLILDGARRSSSEGRWIDL